MLNRLKGDANRKCPITNAFSCKLPMHELSDIENFLMSDISYTCISYRTLKFDICFAPFLKTDSVYFSFQIFIFSTEMAPKRKTKSVASKTVRIHERKKVKKSTGSKRLQYSEHQMNLALEEIKKNKISIRDAANKFNVPKSTLNDKVRGVVPAGRKIGPKPLLGIETENKIVKCLFTLADAGFPLTKQQLIDNVRALMSQSTNNPFSNGLPGRMWFQLFRSRHPEISMRVAQNISRARAGVTEENIRKWFEKTQSFCETSGCLEALMDSRRVYNFDETAFFLAPAPGKVMVKKGSRTVYNTTKANDRQCTTVLMGGNAAGQLAPPMVIFKNKIFPKNISSKWPDKWGIGK